MRRLYSGRKTAGDETLIKINNHPGKKILPDRILFPGWYSLCSAVTVGPIHQNLLCFILISFAEDSIRKFL